MAKWYCLHCGSKISDDGHGYNCAFFVSLPRAIHIVSARRNGVGVLLILCCDDWLQISAFPPLLSSVTICSIICSTYCLLRFANGGLLDVTAIHYIPDG